MQANTDHPLSNEQQDIVDLLLHELTELAEKDHEVLDNGKFSEQEELLYEHYIHLEHIANAVELAGLTGLASCCKTLSVNFKILSETQTAAPDDLNPPMSQWATFFLNYLQDLGRPQLEHEHCEKLVAFLAQPSLPKAFTDAEVTRVIEQFDLSFLASFNDEDDNPIPTEVREEMLSLEIPPDVRPELLQGMLIELPEQMRQFEQSVTAFLRTDQFSDLAQAQRVAHTIKGAANTVAIQGLANLTHYTEDLMETAAKHLDSAPTGFEDLLIQLSDCLATTAEFLNHEGPAPTDLKDVLQMLFDWLNQLKHGDTGKHVSDNKPSVEANAEKVEKVEKDTNSKSQTARTDSAGVKHNQAHEKREQNDTALSTDTESDLTPLHDVKTTVEASASAVATQNTLKDTSSAATHTVAQVNPLSEDDSGKAVEENERFINLPESRAHELLRLSGEVQIANNQVNSQIGSMQNSLVQTERFHNQIKEMASELETLVQTQSALKAASQKQSDDEIDPLEMDRFNELHTFANQLLELTTDSYESISNIEQQIRELNTLNLQQKRLNDDNQHILLQLNLTSAEQLTSRFMRCVRQACRLTGKSANLSIEGEKLLLDNRVLNRIADPIMHLLRNAIDHGLEASSEIRERAGKTAEGNLKLSFINHGDTIKIECQDDGRGLNYGRIQETAIKRGLLPENIEANENLLNQIICMPGFSTRESASQTSGRGIGLDSAIADIRALKGHVSIESEKDKGCKFTITVPTSILTSHALLVQCSTRKAMQHYAITSRAFEQIIYVEANDFIQNQDGVFFEYKEKQIPVHTLNELLGVITLQDEEATAILITKREDGQHIAIAVERIVASQAFVIKPLNRYSYPVPGVIGATILGDGTVSPVIDLHELPSMNLTPEEFNLVQDQRAKIIAEQRANYVEPPAALIVDDSLSARRTLAQFVADLGMNVYTAKDGFDAISVMEERKPSLMLVDLEMPRMNGLELTAHIRGRQEFKDIPVIMITSRSTSRHMEMARRAGVTKYLTKPWSDDELMSCIEEELKAAEKVTAVAS
ncbi:Chemotaxis protein CheA [Thalassocella blandensis]|nr:Chemotaxis protein CheA [Thalassocella blandensis]